MKVQLKITKDFDITHINVSAEPRYWNDSKVNGEYDIDLMETDGTPLMPCAVKLYEEPKTHIKSDNWRWQPLINVETGQIENWTKGTIASLHYKVCDCFVCDFLDEDGDAVKSYDGYVPDFMCPKESGYGDYIIMDIDENGFIQWWNKSLVKSFLEEEEE